MTSLNIAPASCNGSFCGEERDDYLERNERR